MVMMCDDKYTSQSASLLASGIVAPAQMSMKTVNNDRRAIVGAPSTDNLRGGCVESHTYISAASHYHMFVCVVHVNRACI